MKDKFFAWCDKLYAWIYARILWVTYAVYMFKKGARKPGLSKEEKREVKQYWKGLIGKGVTLNDYKWYKDKGAEINPKLIPETVYHSKIEPYFADLRMLEGFKDKNYFDTIIDKQNSPVALLRCIKGQLLDGNYLPLTTSEAKQRLFDAGNEVICKPTIDSCGGRGIKFIDTKHVSENDILNFKTEYKNNFIVQKIVKQHQFLDLFNPTSLNTIRVLSFLFNGEVHILSAFLRIGKSGSRVDNLSSGGYCIQVKNDGKMGSFALDYQGNRYDSIESGLDFTNLAMPSWCDAVETVKKHHYKLAHFQLINWDITIDENSTPIVVEYNLIDTSVLRHQLNVGPLFGELTEEVIKTVYRKK